MKSSSSVHWTCLRPTVLAAYINTRKNTYPIFLLAHKLYTWYSLKSLKLKSKPIPEKRSYKISVGLFLEQKF